MRNKTKIVPFEYESYQFRSIVIEENPFFVGKDVCCVIGLKNHRQALSGLDDDERRVSTIMTPGGKQELVFVNESGLYSLIFKSRKPEARPFRKWVTSEVLPTLRKTGRYEMTNALTTEQADLQQLVKKASAVIGSQNKLSARCGTTKGVVSFVANGRFELVSEEMHERIRIVCNHILTHGVGYDVKIMELLIQVKDDEVRMGLFETMKKGGAL